MMKHRTKLSQSTGLSLMELLVAIAIVGLAAAIGIPTYNQMSQDRHKKEAEAHLQQMLSAVRTQMRQHPTSLTQVADVNDDWMNNWQTNVKNYASLPAGEIDATTPNVWISGSGNKQVQYFFDEGSDGALRLVAQFADNSSVFVDINGSVGGNQTGNPNDACNYNAQCNDSNPCTFDSCIFDSNVNHYICSYSNNDGAACNDNDGCTTGETCSGGACGNGSSTVCNDNNSCTDDLCVSPTGCSHPAINEGQTCTLSSPNACINNPTCQNGVCEGATITTCENIPECKINECDVITGCDVGSMENAGNDTLCEDDGDVCNGVKTCQIGICEMTSPALNCDDNNPCTTDSCDSIQGCLHQALPAGTSCDTDNDLCNGAPVCDGFGTCSSLNPAVICHPSPNFCTSQQCNPSTGQCEPIQCPPGTVCNETLNQCTQCASDNDCADGNSCTSNTCLDNGACSTLLIPDGNPCDNSLFCDGIDICEGGECKPQGNACPEPDKPYCSESDGSCNECGDDSQCNDDNPCTNDKCDLDSLTCLFENVDNDTSCDDGLFCNGVGICSGGSCVTTPGCSPDKPNCVESNDSCFACSTNQDCNDNNPCTTDKCLVGGLCMHAIKLGCTPIPPVPSETLNENQIIP